jgi:hypothetical protein
VGTAGGHVIKATLIIGRPLLSGPRSAEPISPRNTAFGGPKVAPSAAAGGHLRETCSSITRISAGPGEPDHRIQRRCVAQSARHRLGSWRLSQPGPRDVTDLFELRRHRRRKAQRDLGALRLGHRGLRQRRAWVVLVGDGGRRQRRVRLCLIHHRRVLKHSDWRCVVDQRGCRECGDRSACRHRRRTVQPRRSRRSDRLQRDRRAWQCLRERWLGEYGQW